MLPFVVAGGIFIAIAFLIDIACGVNAQEVGSAFGTVTPAAAWFKTLGGVAFNLMVPILPALSQCQLQTVPVFSLVL